MAETANKSDQGKMDISGHIKTWNGFLSLVKWVIIGNIVLLVLLAIFRTHG